jgi:3-(3-hydroxy-phenyl)propionate hydroxylase
MCQGLRDATNLAWKLDWVLTGRASDVLLDSYGEERGPQVQDVTATVKRLGHIICERDAIKANERDRNLREQQGGQVKMQLRQSLLPGVHHGLIDRDVAPAGTPFPQPVGRLDADAEAQMLDDLVPNGFLLVLRDAPEADHILQWADSLARLGIQVVSINGNANAHGVLSLLESDNVLAAWFARNECAAALVRPDHIVFGVASDSADIGALLASASRKLGPMRDRGHGVQAVNRHDEGSP